MAKKMRAFQVAKANGPFELVERDIPGAGAAAGAYQGRGLRHLPQRLVGQGRHLPGYPVQGWPSGTAVDSADTLAFSAESGVRPIIETMPLERAPEAYERMMSGKARFRMVLTMTR